MSVEIESYEDIGDGVFQVRFRDGPMIEAAIHELKRLNGTLPPVRFGGMRPAKGGE